MSVLFAWASRLQLVDVVFALSCVHSVSIQAEILQNQNGLQGFQLRMLGRDLMVFEENQISFVARTLSKLLFASHHFDSPCSRDIG